MCSKLAHRHLYTAYMHTHGQLHRLTHSELIQTLKAPMASSTHQDSHMHSYICFSCCHDGHGPQSPSPLPGAAPIAPDMHTCTLLPGKSWQQSLMRRQDRLLWPSTGHGQLRVATSSLLRENKLFLSLYFSFSPSLFLLKPPWYTFFPACGFSTKQPIIST